MHLRKETSLEYFNIVDYLLGYLDLYLEVVTMVNQGTTSILVLVLVLERAKILHANDSN